MSDKEYTECCLNGNLERIKELQNDVTFVTYTKQCIGAIKNGHYDIVEYLVNLPNNNILYKANNYYILKESCKKNLLSIIKKIICLKDIHKFSNMIRTAYENDAFDVLLYLLQLTSVIPEYITDIYKKSCIYNHNKLKMYIESLYKHYHYCDETEEIIAHTPTVIVH